MTVSIKGVCRRPGEQAVLLARNPRGTWELPGGRPELGEQFPDCLRREVFEEAGARVIVDGLVDAFPFEVIAGRWVTIIVYRCRLENAGQFTVSHEHTEVALVDPEDVPDRLLPGEYRRAIRAAADVARPVLGAATGFQRPADESAKQ